MSKEVVLVTGGTGLVGKAIEEIAGEQCPNLTFVFLGSKDANLANLEEAKRIFEKYQPSFVIHLAAVVGGLFKNMDNNLHFFRTNMQINDNVLRLSYEFNVKKCVSCLSTCNFPDQTSYPINETMLHLGPPHNSNFGNSFSKRMIDVLNKLYTNQQSCKGRDSKTIFTSVIPTNVYGPFSNFNLRDSHVIPGLIHKAYLAAQQAKSKGETTAKLTLCGTGKPQRQFIYSSDVAYLILWVLQNYNAVEPIILSVDEADEISIEKAANLISEAFARYYNINFEIVKDTSMADGQFKKTASNQKLRGFLPNFKFTPIEEGIETCVQWFCSNYKTCRK